MEITIEQLALFEVREMIARLPNEKDRIMVECMAQTIRNIANANSPLGALALGLVGAEWAAKP